MNIINLGLLEKNEIKKVNKLLLIGDSGESAR